MSYSMADIDRPFGMLNIHRCTTCVENLLKEDFDEMGNPREGEGGPDCVSLARQEIRRSESGVPVRATGKGLGGREGAGRDPVRQPGRRAIPLQGEWRRAVQLRCDHQEVQAHGPGAPRHGRNRAHGRCGPANAACRGSGARGDGPRVPDECERRFREHATPVPRVRRALLVLQTQGRGESQVGARDLMSLRLLGSIELLAHAKDGGFDHAAVHHGSSRLYVAHTSNDDVDVVDSSSDRFLESIHGLKGVAGAFYVNIADPPLIVGIDANHPSEIRETFEIPSKGPHGLDLDPRARQLFCACDEGKLVTVHLDTGEVRLIGDLSGPPDVVFFNRALRRVYVAVGFPGVVDVFDARRMRILEAVPTEKGAHTLAFDYRKNKVYVFLPATHRAAVYQDD